MGLVRVKMSKDAVFGVQIENVGFLYIWGIFERGKDRSGFFIAFCVSGRKLGWIGSYG